MNVQTTQFEAPRRFLRRRRRLSLIALIVVLTGEAQAALAQSALAPPSGLPAAPASQPLIVQGQVGQARNPAVQFSNRAPMPPANSEDVQPLPPDDRLVDDGAHSLPAPAPTGGANYGARSLSAAKDAPNLKAAPLETTDLALPINFATALRLSDARPLIVSAAQASAWVAEAQLQRAKVIKVPTLDFGAVYVRHDGFGPDFNRGDNEPAYTPGLGGPLNQNLNFLYAGGSLYLTVPMTDAIFQPLVARQVLNSRRFDVQTAKNNALLMTANQYFDVHRSRGQYAGALDTVARGEKLRERILRLSEDLVPRVEVDRATRMLADMQQHAVSARQQWRVASANLTQVLRLDPRAVIIPLEPDHLQITMIDPARPLDELMPIALSYRPEIGAQRALIQAAEAGIRREKNRPVLPTILITGFQSPGGMAMQLDVFALGSDGKMNNVGLRDDVSLQAIWQVEGFGLGNLARIKAQRGQESQAIVKLYHIQDAVAAEVNRSQARLQAAAVRVVQAERSMREAIITFEGNYEGLAQTKRFDNVLVQVYRPQEAVIALDHLLVAYDQYFATVADYNRAQFELFHALGYPAREVASLRPPGEFQPVDTDRPAYLPPVGVGPPPANR